MKISEPMIGISLYHAAPPSHAQDSWCRILAEHRINLTFITTRKIDEENSFCFYCVDFVEQSDVAHLLNKKFHARETTCRILPDVTLLSVFPHQSDTRMAFHMLQALWHWQIQLHAVATSIAALTFVIDTEQIDATVGALKTLMDIQL